jgi:hypothetical protein
MQGGVDRMTIKNWLAINEWLQEAEYCGDPDRDDVRHFLLKSPFAIF